MGKDSCLAGRQTTAEGNGRRHRERELSGLGACWRRAAILSREGLHPGIEERQRPQSWIKNERTWGEEQRERGMERERERGRRREERK